MLMALTYLGLTVLDPPGSPNPPGKLDLLKAAFTAVAGIGGVVALVVAYRKQRVNERSQQHTEYAELYGQAVEQLGHDKAAVRLGGLYSLERLAQDHPQHRQTVVDVMCAYLRMPFEAPGSDTLESRTRNHLTFSAVSTTDPGDRAAAKQELQVRLTAQRLLVSHLSADVANNQKYWKNINVDLNGAHLVEFDFINCKPHNADFANAQLIGRTSFDGTTFGGDARFGKATFEGDAWFDEARFEGDASFGEARFGGAAVFGGARFEREPDYRDVSAIIYLDDLHSWPEPWHVEQPPPGEELGRLVRRADPETSQAADTTRTTAAEHDATRPRSAR
jgi:hypothetical protein